MEYINLYKKWGKQWIEKDIFPFFFTIKERKSSAGEKKAGFNQMEIPNY